MRSEGSTYLLPTIVLCASPDHPLANREFLFPFASVVPVAPEDLPERLGPSLAVTAITEDEALVRRLLASPLVHRLNLGPDPHPAGDLGPAPRGQPVRAPLRAPRDPAARRAARRRRRAA